MAVGRIAIIGLGCRFPKADNPESYWQLLRNGIDGIKEVPSDRWDVDVLYDQTPATPGKMSTRWGGFLEKVDQFDADFFGISPRESERIDPQQRLLLEVSWEALENGGVAPSQLKGTQTGVFIGISNNDYGRMGSKDISTINAYSGTGSAFCIAANRISYLLNLKGASLAIDTACSSSLVAVHYACQSLLSGESDLCLAGGVNLILSPEATIAFSQARMMAADGRCKTFDDRADGYVRGEGCGIVVLKRLSDALKDGDNIRAIIRSTAVNQDGLTNGITAPNGPSQQAVIRQALKKAGVKPAQISYVEAHGTGTPLGDPQEMKSLKAVLLEGRQSDQPCWIGSVKTNIGHLESAAGIAGLIKVILSLQNKEIPPHLHLQKLNRYISLEGTPIAIPTKCQPWEIGNEPRLAGINSFGFGGTNAHAILEEAPIQNKQKKGDRRPWHLLTLSAKTEPALKELANRYVAYLSEHSEISLGDVCFTAHTGRDHFNQRMAIATQSIEQLQEQLVAFGEGQEIFGLYSGEAPRKKTPKIAFLFTGQGSQYVGMGRQLYETQPTFRSNLDRCAEILSSYLEKPLLEVIYPPEGEPSPLDETAYTQPALFAIEYALYELWRSWGVKPKVVMGHSIGEYVAACVAGVFSLEEGLKLIAHRGRLMQALPHNGKMVSVLADEATVRKAIEPYEGKVALAAYNGPQSIVISGEIKAVESAKAKLEAEGIKTKPLLVSHAFHSHLMEPILGEFREIAQSISYAEPKIDLVSNVTGKIARSELATPDYWCGHIRQAVRFADSLEELHQQGSGIFLEVGCKPILLGMGRSCVPEGEHLWLPSLRLGQSGWQQILSSLGQLYIQGVTVDWSGFNQDYSHEKVELPTYPFQRQRYWIETEKNYFQKKQPLFRGKILHRLLGEKLYLAGLEKQHRFESQISASEPAYLSHHRIFEQAILPATAYLEIALAAGLNRWKSPKLLVEDVVLQRGLILPEDELKTVQTILTPLENEAYQFQIFSQGQKDNQDEPTWILHGSGKISSAKTDTIPLSIDLEKYLTECEQPIEITEYYQKYKQRGMDYGASFQGIQQLWKGSKQAVGKIKLSPELVEQATDYQLHPALLDAAFQVIGAAMEETDSDHTYLPVGIRKLRVYGRPNKELWAIVSMKGQTLESDITLLDEQRTVVAQIEGLRLMATTAQALLHSWQVDINDWLYEIDWQAQILDCNVESISTSETGSWLLFVPSLELGQQLSETLQQKEQETILVSPGLEYQQLNSQHYQINPTQPEQFSRLLQETSDIKVIVHLWSLTETKESLSWQDLETAQELGCASVLHLLQAIAKTQLKDFPVLWLVTQGTQTVWEESEVKQPQSAPLWGLGRVVSLEYPDLLCRRVDLDPSSQFSEAIPMLESELLYSNREDQIAYRQGLRYVSRLVRQKQHQSKEKGKLQMPVGEPFQLKLSAYGLLDNLNWQPMQRLGPKPNEVEIQVKAVGLNFRDVLNALGLLQDYYAQELGITSAEQLTFGFECAGIISQVGEQVTQWQVGDEVMAALIPNGFSSFVTVPAELVMLKPQQISFEEAATLPLTFLTASYGLHELAKIKPAEKVLIHAAAGGVGQAAVQIAQQVGAEVFATASPPKWKFLHSLGIKQVMNSRTLDFAEEIMNLTQGEGVDIVFNSLNGEFIDKSFEILTPRGRFVEIGKIGIWSQEQVQQKRPDVSYFPFDLGEVARENTRILVRGARKLEKEWEQGNLKPLPYKVFAKEEVIDAFRYMQQAKHIGKVVVSMTELSQEKETEISIQPEASYLITGGVGALGLEVAQWLVGQGARHLILTGRRKPSQTAQQKVEELEKLGAKISVLWGDISQQEDIVKIFEQIQGSGTELKGIIHAAGVLDDGVLQQISWERFTKVMAPKVQGSWHLHQLTQHLDLDFFVCFSSIAALLGSPGQGNYAAANAFMDALAHYRRGMGLPALTINWGPWAQAGMVARLEKSSSRQFMLQGIELIVPEQGLKVLKILLAQKTSQVAVLPISWPKFFEGVSPAINSPLLEELGSVSQQSKEKASEFLASLKTGDPSDRHFLILSYIKSKVSKALGIDSNQLDIQQPLNNMGLDSLMALELRNIIFTELQVEIAIEKFLENSSIAQLSELLLEKLTWESLMVQEPLSEDLEEDMEEFTL